MPVHVHFPHHLPFGCLHEHGGGHDVEGATDDEDRVAMFVKDCRAEGSVLAQHISRDGFTQRVLL